MDINGYCAALSLTPPFSLYSYQEFYYMMQQLKTMQM